MKTIDSFKGEYSIFSNFHTSYRQVCMDGVWYNSVEHAFQAAKTLIISERVQILNASYPGTAKKLGRKVTLRPDWEDIKIGIMTDLVRQKFTNDIALKTKLLESEDAILIEGNYWHDTFWGVCDGVGENNLGKILMQIREELKKERQ